jgi:ATP-binding cassette subfamily B protein
MDNILFGNPGATEGEAMEAAKQANAHGFIMELPNGYDTEIGQRGVKLSGGQQQRLSIARVFLKDPPILIFDEATSALDYESERAVMDSLATLAKGRTAFIIAHRLSTIKNADRIIVLTDEGISEQGTHDELCVLGGEYAKLYGGELVRERRIPFNMVTQEYLNEKAILAKLAEAERELADPNIVLLDHDEVFAPIRNKHFKY